MMMVCGELCNFEAVKDRIWKKITLYYKNIEPKYKNSQWISPTTYLLCSTKQWTD